MIFENNENLKTSSSFLCSSLLKKFSILTLIYSKTSVIVMMLVFPISIRYARDSKNMGLLLNLMRLSS